MITYLQWRVLYCTCANKGSNNSHNVDRQLELKKFRDTVVNIATPHNSLDNAAKIVICENNIRGFFGNVSSSNTLECGGKKRDSMKLIRCQW